MTIAYGPYDIVHIIFSTSYGIKSPDWFIYVVKTGLSHTGT